MEGIHFCTGCERIFNVKNAKKTPTCPKCHMALLDMKISYDDWMSFSSWKKEIYKRICHIVSLGTYIDNDITLEKCLCCDAEEEVLFPHEIKILEMVKSNRVDDSFIACRSDLDIWDLSKCISNLVIRGYIKHGLSMDSISKMLPAQLRSIARANNLIPSRASMTDAELVSIVEQGLLSNQISDNEDIGIFYLTEIGDAEREKYPDIKYGAEKNWEVFSKAFKCNFNDSSLEKRLFIYDSYLRLYCNKENNLRSLKQIDGTQVNDFINVYDIDKVFHEGIYKIGEDIESGEYYFWGDNITVVNSREEQIHEDFIYDFYYKLPNKRKITVCDGAFTRIDNICYRHQDEYVLSDKHMYKSDVELSSGDYIFCRKNNLSCYVDIYERLADRVHPCYSGIRGSFHIDTNCKYLRISDGYACLKTKGNFISEITRNKIKKVVNEIEENLSSQMDSMKLVLKNDKVLFYITPCNTVAEAFINTYYKDATRLVSPFPNDNSINYRFSVPQNDKDEICLVYYMFISKRITLPNVYGMPINHFYRNLRGRLLGNSNKEDEIDYAVGQNHLFDDKSVSRFFERLISIFPACLFSIFSPEKAYTKAIHPEFDKRYYYHSLNNESFYGDKYYSILSTITKAGRKDIKWKNEILVYALVKCYYPDAIFQYSAKWLGRQTLDIYIPSINLGIEYQGEQHYQAIERFGGVEGLEFRRKMDSIKRRKCLQNRVILIEWYYKLPINDETLSYLFGEQEIILPPKSVVFPTD